MKNKKKIIAIIPARYNSVRLPGKPLIKIKNKYMIEYVYQNAAKSKFFDKIIVATDDYRIKDAVENFGGNAVMTDNNIKTGTDRIYQALNILDEKYDIVVNLQGDEPLLKSWLIDETIIKLLDNYKEAFVSTPICKIKNKEYIFDHNKVKAVIDINDYALYFSRSPIPYERAKYNDYYMHIGLYVYKYDFLQKFVNFKQAEIEIAESLEQLRILYNGYKIICQKVEYQPCGVDTVEDLKIVEKLL